MLHFISRWIFLLVFTTCIFSCKKDGPEFLKRNTDHLSFAYNESTAHFTIRATGDWSIVIPEEYNWISVSPQQGKGDGSTYQEIQVTCKSNPGVERQGVIYLEGSGQSQVPITIDQENGVFEWLRYGNGSYLSLADQLVLNAPSTASIAIPYVKATGQETVSVEVSYSGTGAAGLTPATHNLTLDAGDGLMKIPVAGTPTTQGVVQISVQVDGQDFGTIETVTGIGQTVVDQRFDKFPWGGDCIANKGGITTTVATASMTLSDPTIACTVETNGANGSGVTSTIRNSNPVFYKEIGMENWTGLRNYMRPGYIQLGAASATAQEYGSLITPPLDLPAGNFDLLVRFKVAVYKDPFPPKLVVGLVPTNTTGITITNYSSITNAVQLPVDMPFFKWVDYTCVIRNATNQSSLVISLPEDLNQSGAVQASRIFLDDINVSY